MSFFVGLLALVLAIRLLPVVLRARELLSRRLARPSGRVASEGEVPPELALLLRRADAWAQPLGFDEVG